MLENQLKQLGLSDKEAIVYEKLASLGVVQPATLSKPTKLGRTTVYAVLQQMEKKGLVERKTVEGKIHFVISHPSNLKGLLKIREKDLENDKKTLENILPTLTSEYNLVSNKPNVRYFEGDQGMWEVLNDSLTAKETVLQYSDPKAVDDYIPIVNEKYAKARTKLQVKKKIIVIDTPWARNYFKNYRKDITEVKFLQHEESRFFTSMMIYDGKISYLVLTKKQKIGVLIENEYIYKLQKMLFEFNWKNAEDI